MGATSGSGGQGAIERRLGAHSKDAGALVYLVEELGDARMRCDQLLRYVDKATKLIEKSSHKDHFFEVAGDVIRGIPETAFKLHKALQAVALAANRIDYEEIKQDLRPEKAEELERVLEDVRVRQVQRRSQPMSLKPENVVEQLRGLAKQAREQGRLDTDGLGNLIAALENGSPKVADDAGAKAAAQLEAMVNALENPPEGQMPSRVRLAQVLRKTYAEHVEVVSSAMSSKEAQLFKSVEEEAMFEVAGAMRALKNLLRGTGNPRRTRTLLMSALGFQARLTTVLGQDPAIAAALERASDILFRNWSMTNLLDKDVPSTMYEPADARLASEDDKLSRYEEGKSADPTKNMSEEDAKAWKENTDEYGDKFKKEAKGDLTMLLPPPGIATFSPEDATTSVDAVITSLKELRRFLTTSSSMRPGAIGIAFKEAIVELSAVAWHLNMPDLSAILDKARIKSRVKSLDRVAFAGGEPDPESLEGLDETLENLLTSARRASGFGARADYERMFFNLIKVVGNVQALARNFDVPGMSILDRVIKTFVPFAGGTRPMLAAAEGDEKHSRYEEGKPADPTKNMSEEDAKAWKENTDEYGDKFKAAADKVAKKIPAPDDSSIITEIMSWHGGQGTNLYSVGSTWNAGRDVDADDAEEAYDELKRKRADRDALEAFEEHLSEHGVKLASVESKEAFGSKGRVYLHYVKGGTKRREGPLDPQLAKRRMVALMEDGSVSEADFERKAAKARQTDEDWKAA
jgi:hypothetical protein